MFYSRDEADTDSTISSTTEFTSNELPNKTKNDDFSDRKTKM